MKEKRSGDAFTGLRYRMLIPVNIPPTRTGDKVYGYQTDTQRQALDGPKSINVG